MRNKKHFSEWPDKRLVATSQAYWLAGVYRFDDPDPGGAEAFGTFYAASTIEVVFAGSLMDEYGRLIGSSYEVPAAEQTDRSVVRLTSERRKTLLLADLTRAALKALGLKKDISASGNRTTSQAWPRAIHSSSPRWDEIRYASRQMNKGFADAILRAQRASQAGRRDAQGAAGR